MKSKAKSLILSPKKKSPKAAIITFQAIDT